MEDPTVPLKEQVKPVIARDAHGRLLPGQPSINPAGRPKRKTLTELLHDKMDIDTSTLTWDQAAEIILKLYKGEDKDIIKEFWHMTDGKPRESVDLNAVVTMPHVTVDTKEEK